MYELIILAILTALLIERVTKALRIELKIALKIKF